MLEQTFCVIKPDGVKRGLSEEITNRIKQSGLAIKENKNINISKEQAEKLYTAHKSKAFYQGLVKFITSAPVEMMVLEGDDAVSKLRKLMGETDPREALVGTIRGDLKEEKVLNHDGILKNIIHGSDSQENAKYEISIFF
ncbi:MAG: nucleoside-diphosphate kinase [Candidatus Saganbacteria bacterium]|uniref:nucleoside-diphosphate kinase n=1 Tax=Candidatus Saganbacteria bacterium TaxID=2575572 RepID=A0A833NWB4_UNCSA|nr:MAG: nucleoside-diphosphate kinase [Candidatus Saganbacteria bacterium]